MFFKIDALKNFANFTGKHLCWSLFLIKLQPLWPVKNTLLYRTPPVAASDYFQIFVIDGLQFFLKQEYKQVLWQGHLHQATI